MSFISNIFTSKPAAPAQQPAQQQQQAAPANPHVANNPTIPNGNNVPATTATSEPANGQSPTDNFASLWSTPTQQQGNQQPNFKFAPDQLNQVASKMDFTQGLNPETLTKIQQGGPESVQAFMDALNHVGRQAFTQSATLSSHLTEQGYQAGTQSVNKSLPNLVNNHLAKDALFNSNPALRDPALQPLVSAVQLQIQQQHPNATPAEINSAVQAYFAGPVAKAFAPAPKQDKASNGTDSFDFSSFMDPTVQPQASEYQ